MNRVDILLIVFLQWIYIFSSQMYMPLFLNYMPDKQCDSLEGNSSIFGNASSYGNATAFCYKVEKKCNRCVGNCTEADNVCKDESCSNEILASRPFKSAAAEYGHYCDQIYQVFRAETVQYAGVFVGTILFGSLSDVYGRKSVLLVGLLLGVPTMLLSGEIYSFPAFYTLRALTGLFTGSSMVVGWGLISELAAPDKRMHLRAFATYVRVKDWIFHSSSYSRPLCSLRVAGIMVAPSLAPGILDSVVYSDELTPGSPLCAGTKDGRYVFQLVKLPEDGPDSGKFGLDIIDLFLGRTTRIRSLGEMSDYGEYAGFYVLDKNRVIALDYNEEDETLRQRVIKIDHENATADYIFCRMYEVSFTPDHPNYTTHGELWNFMRTTNQAILYPADPLSSHSWRDGAAVLDQVFTFAESSFRRRNDPSIDFIQNCSDPFFISSTVLGFFICFGQNGIRELMWDTEELVVVDIDTNECYITATSTVTSSSPFPSTTMESSYWNQAGCREFLVIARFANNIYITAAFHPQRMEWTVMKKVNLSIDDDLMIVPGPSAAFVIADEVDTTEGSRCIGKFKADADRARLKRIRVLQNPRRVASLLQIAMIATQRSGLYPTECLQEIKTLL